MYTLPQPIGSKIRVPTYDQDLLTWIVAKGFWPESGTPQYLVMRRDMGDDVLVGPRPPLPSNTHIIEDLA